MGVGGVDKVNWELFKLGSGSEIKMGEIGKERRIVFDEGGSGVEDGSGRAVVIGEGNNGGFGETGDEFLGVFE